MPHVNDLKLAKLGGTSVDQIDDLEIKFLHGLGASSDQVNNAWAEVFRTVLGPTATGNFNTDALAWLGVQGTTSPNLSDAWAEYWGMP